MTCGIYYIENIINHKKYIGQSSNIEKRIRTHFKKLTEEKHANLHLQSSFNKYGEKSFVGGVVCECEKESLDTLEIYYINVYNSTDRTIGYNILVGGGGTRGRVVSKETREKISKINKGRVFSEERNKKISDSKKGKPANISKEQREKITDANTGKKISTRKTTSNYKGVSYCQRDKSWRIYLKGKAHGSFADELCAAKRYDEISWNMFHNLKKLNFPENYLEKE